MSTRKRCIQEHKATDKRSSDGKERAKRLQQKAETLNKAADRIDEFLAAEQPKIGQGKTKKEIKSNITDNESAKRAGFCSCKTCISYIHVGHYQ